MVAADTRETRLLIMSNSFTQPDAAVPSNHDFKVRCDEGSFSTSRTILEKAGIFTITSVITYWSMFEQASPNDTLNFGSVPAPLLRLLLQWCTDDQIEFRDTLAPYDGANSRWAVFTASVKVESRQLMALVHLYHLNDLLKLELLEIYLKKTIVEQFIAACIPDPSSDDLPIEALPPCYNDTALLLSEMIDLDKDRSEATQLLNAVMGACLARIKHLPNPARQILHDYNPAAFKLAMSALAALGQRFDDKLVEFYAEFSRKRDQGRALYPTVDKYFFDKDKKVATAGLWEYSAEANNDVTGAGPV